MESFTFFKETDDFIPIMRNVLEDDSIYKTNLDKISTGWTNIVYDVSSKGKNYIFRFPRNNFFSIKILSDVKACHFYKEKINLKTINLRLCFDKKNRPFSVHEKLAGIDLSKRIDKIDENKKNIIIKEIAECYHQIHTISISKNDPIELQESFFNFANELARVDDNYYDYSKHDIIKKLEKEKKNYIHGDLNIRNILLNDNDSIVAFLDYSFCSLSSPYIDLARMAPSVDKDFLNKLIFEYEKLSNVKIDNSILKECVVMWKYIEEQYIVYMKKFFPEIKI